MLDKGSPLTACVSQAVDALRADGTLAELEEQWLAQVAGAPELSSDRRTLADQRGRAPPSRYQPSAWQRQRDAYRRRQTVRSVLVAAASTARRSASLLVRRRSPARPAGTGYGQSFFDSAGRPRRAAATSSTGCGSTSGCWSSAPSARSLLGLLIALLRTLRGPVFFPLRALATGYTYTFRGAAADHRAVPVRLRACRGCAWRGTPSVLVLGGIALVAHLRRLHRRGVPGRHRVGAPAASAPRPARSA